LKTSKLF